MNSYENETVTFSYKLDKKLHRPYSQKHSYTAMSTIAMPVTAFAIFKLHTFSQRST